MNAAQVTQLVRDSAAGNGLAVSPRGIRLVTYRQASDGSWVGCWFAAERSLKAARKRLRAARVAGILAEVIRDGKPVAL